MDDGAEIPNVQEWMQDETKDDDDDGDDLEKETQCRRFHVAIHGPGVPFFLAGARPRGCKGWAWLLAARTLAADRPGVGRVDYGPDRFYMGDLDGRGLSHGYGAMVVLGQRSNVADARSVHTWHERAVLWWYEGYWRHGARQGEGLKVCTQRSAAMDGHWRDDRFDGNGMLAYGRGRWTLAPDGPGSGRWTDGDTWRFDGKWRNGERHGPGTLTIRGLADPIESTWANGVMADAGGMREPTSDSVRSVSPFRPGHRRAWSHPEAIHSVCSF